MANFQYASITPSDTEPQVGLVMAIFVGSPGDVAIKATGDSAAVTLTAPTVGKWIYLPHPVLFVMQAGTSATFLIAALATSARPTSNAT